MADEDLGASVGECGWAMGTKNRKITDDLTRNPWLFGKPQKTVRSSYITSESSSHASIAFDGFPTRCSGPVDSTARTDRDSVAAESPLL